MRVSSSAKSGEMVVTHKWELPGFSPARIPSSPFKMSMIDLSSISDVTTISAAAAACFADPAAFAPIATSGAIFDAVLFHTANSIPCFTIFAAIPEPMRPSPINAILQLICVEFLSETIGTDALIEVVFSALANVGDFRTDVIPAMRRLLLGEMREHLDAEAPIQVVGDPLPPRTPYDLGGKAPGSARLRHDVIGDLPRPLEKLVRRQDLVDHPIFQRQLGVDGLTRE